MARLRKAGRVWRSDDARGAAARVLVTSEGSYFAIEPESLFARAAPLEVELGAGRGDFITDRASHFPEHNFLAVELAASVAQRMAVRAGYCGLTNLRVVRMDARPLVNLMLPDRSVGAYHVYFPDPWPKERHLKHRLFNPFFAASLKRTLAPGGALYVATDVRIYARTIFAMVEEAGMRREDVSVPGACATGFARKFIAAGRAVYAAAFVRQAECRPGHPGAPGS
jgi:tRNA (guanine-N7-)-methyltransferase